MSAPLVADMGTYICALCCRYRGSYMCAPLILDIEDLT